MKSVLFLRKQTWLSICVALFLAGGCFAFFAHAEDAYEGCPLAGSTGARLTIVEFADFACPYCAQAESLTKNVLTDYAGQVRLVFRNLPRPGHGPIAVMAAKAFLAVCLQNSSAAPTYLKELFEHQNQLSESFLFSTAQDLHIDVTRMKSDMSGPEVAKRMAKDQEMADSNHLNKTPSFMVGRQAVIGLYPYADFKKFLDRQLAAP